MQYVRSVINTVKDKRNRRWLAIVHFFAANPEYLRRLSHVSPVVVIEVILINIMAMGALAWAYDSMLRLCGKPLGIKENVMLTAYSSIVNFFGPLQSGPGIRAIYLKTRHHIRMRDYLLATLVYYAFFATFSGVLLVGGILAWWQTLLGLIAIGGFSWLLIRWFARRPSGSTMTDSPSHFAWNVRPLITLAIAIALQLVFVGAYYYVELHAVNSSISISQAISYTGAANFSLFVSITPDGVGFREAFLVFSQHIHHVTTADIINANIVDRGAYLLYLVLLFAVMILLRVRDRLHLGNRQQQDTNE
jgi:uncharacterized membrane protein YbhN (UPF0104 family)